MISNLPVEPWQPKEGDWVRINPSPECPSWHSQSHEPYPAYGRVESVDRDYDNPEHWVENAPEVGSGYTEEEARRDAAQHFGHFYHVTDTYGCHKRVTWIDGMYAAIELEPVPMAVAILHIVKARKELERLGPGYKLRRMLFGAAGVQL